MKKIFILLTGVMVIILILCMGNFLVAAQDFPTRPITIIVPMAPGGMVDAVCRSFASVAEKFLPQPIVVINKTGSAGMLGMSACAEAAPDGYTLTLVGTPPWATVEWEIANGRKPMVTRNDFTDIGALYQTTDVISVSYDSPWKTLSDLINDGKAKPDHYAFSSYGMYGYAHLETELFMRATGLKFRHVPYDGGGPAITAVVGKHVDFSIVTLGAALSLARGNKLRFLAVLSDTRDKFIPDIPTAKELGVNVESRSVYGLVAPRKTPVPIIKKLREINKKVIDDKVFINFIENTGSIVPSIDSEELTKIYESESEKFAKLLKQLLAGEKK